MLPTRRRRWNDSLRSAHCASRRRRPAFRVDALLCSARSASRNLLAETASYALLGIDALPVRVEVDVVPGLPTFTVVGLPDSAVRESRNRVAAALQHSGFEFPLRRITVNLAPGTLRKEGSAFDLPIALGILAATGQLPREAVGAWSSLGELSLRGELRPARGVLCAAIAQRAAPTTALIVPHVNEAEVRLVDGVRVVGAAGLGDAVAFVRGGRIPAPAVGEEVPAAAGGGEDPDLADVRGQTHAKRALEIAAAGGHNLLLIGPPGAGKSMLARRLPGILPPMSREEVLETTCIHSVAGLLRGESRLRRRPFRSPHHTVSQAGLVGGGGVPRPGEVSLAHNGVLFLDELPEFDRGALEVLRQPLEEGRVTIARARATVSYPARFMLVAAMNPCPCGNLTHPARACTCVESEIRRYRGRVSGPLLDRIDLHVDVPPVPVLELTRGLHARSRPAAGPRRGAKAARGVHRRPAVETVPGPTLTQSAAARERVHRARMRQLERYAGRAVYCNAQLGPEDGACSLDLDSVALELLERAAEGFRLSARAVHRTTRVARTIADLEGAPVVLARHVSEALQYRGESLGERGDGN